MPGGFVSSTRLQAVRGDTGNAACLPRASGEWVSSGSSLILKASKMFEQK